MITKQQLTDEFLTDPGIGFITANILLFANNTNALGFYLCIAALIIAIAIKVLFISEIHFQKESLIFDPRLTLWINCTVLMIVAIGSLLNTFFLAALTGCFLAIANFLIAESISKHEDTEKISFFTLLFKRPGLYLNIGTMLACLLAGYQAIFLIPILLVSLFIALRNMWLQYPECYMHPKLLISLSSIASVGIGIYNKNLTVAAAHVIIALVYISIEVRITDNGIKQILKDLKIRK